MLFLGQLFPPRDDAGVRGGEVCLSSRSFTPPEQGLSLDGILIDFMAEL